MPIVGVDAWGPLRWREDWDFNKRLEEELDAPLRDMTFREQDLPWATSKMTYIDPGIKALLIAAADRGCAAVF